MRLLTLLPAISLLTNDASSSSLVREDNTIRPFNHEDWCIYKRWADYIAGQELWVWPCADAASPNPSKSGKCTGRTIGFLEKQIWKWVFEVVYQAV